MFNGLEVDMDKVDMDESGDFRKEMADHTGKVRQLPFAFDGVNKGPIGT